MAAGPVAERDEYDEILGARIAPDAASAMERRRIVLASRFGPVAVELWPARVNFETPPVEVSALGHAVDWSPEAEYQYGGPLAAHPIPLHALADPLGFIAQNTGRSTLPGGLVVCDEAVAWHDHVARHDASRETLCESCRHPTARGVALAATVRLGGVPALTRPATFCLGCFWNQLRPLVGAEGVSVFEGVGAASCVVLRETLGPLSVYESRDKTTCLIVTRTLDGIARAPPAVPAAVAGRQCYWALKR